MAFWTNEFMNNRRNEWLMSIVKFQYQIGETWYDAVINKKIITGNKLEIIISIPRVSVDSQKISAVRIIDVTGKQAAYQAVNIERSGIQGVLIKFEFPIYEKE